MVACCGGLGLWLVGSVVVCSCSCLSLSVAVAVCGCLWLRLYASVSGPGSLKVSQACCVVIGVVQHVLALRPPPVSDAQITASFVDFCSAPGYHSLVLF